MACTDPYSSYNFAVELDGITQAGFRECSGLDNSQNAGEYREGTDRNQAVRKIPGLVTHGDITLNRGITNDRALWDWRQKVMDGNTERHDISITRCSTTGARPRSRGTCTSAGPASGPARA